MTRARLGHHRRLFTPSGGGAGQGQGQEARAGSEPPGAAGARPGDAATPPQDPMADDGGDRNAGAWMECVVCGLY